MSTLNPRVLGTILGALSLSSLSSMRFGIEFLSHPFKGMRTSPRDRSTSASRARARTLKFEKSGQRKLLRTTRAMTRQGRDLKAHFDTHRLTRSQLKKFYAGKGIAAY